MKLAIKEEVLETNKLLETSGLVQLTWGNTSARDFETGLVAIKPSGVPYSKLKLEHLVVTDLDGKIVEGELNPSVDLKTHLELYKAFPKVGGIVHTHSTWATIFCQANCRIPCFGTTHADHFYGSIPLVRVLTESEMKEDYEKYTGIAIIEHFEKNNIDPLAIPAALQAYHAPFTWGKTVTEAYKNSIALEMCAKMAYHSMALTANLQSLPKHIQDEHYERKNGANASYGQKIAI